MTTLSPPVASATTAAAAEPTPTATADHQRLVSKRVFRTMERNSSTLLALASSASGSQLSRLSLTCNELLRQICARSVQKETIEQIEYCIKDQILKEEGAEPVTYLAKSIVAIGRSVGGLEDTVAPPPPVCSVAPPLEFGDDDNDKEREEELALPSSSTTEALFRQTKKAHSVTTVKQEPVDGGEGEETEKPVGPEGDYCTRIEPGPAPFTEIEEEECGRAPYRYSPSPPPSPLLRELKRQKRKRRAEEERWEREEDVSCALCDTVFHSQKELDGHLVQYHRMKPMQHGEPTVGAASPKKQLQQSGGSAAIISTRPLDGFVFPARPAQLQQLQHVQQQRLAAGGGIGFKGEQSYGEKGDLPIRLTSTIVTSPGGTMRQYSSPSNAARAVAKAAAAAAAGIVRPAPISKPYTCRQCGMVLTSQQMYASHVRYNHPKEKTEEEKKGEKREGGGVVSATPVARKSGSGKESAIIRLQLEDGTVAFECRRCSKVFDTAQKVAGHSRHCLLVFEGKARPANRPVPAEDRPYTVYRCGLSSELARTCPYCGELMPSVRKVDKHVRTMHGGERHEVYGCTTCDRRFVTLGGIENHWLHYGDCPQGVLCVHRNGEVTVADIGDVPPPLKKYRPPTTLLHGQSTRAAAAAAAAAKDNDDDPSVSIVNAILGAHGFKVNGKGAPDLTADLDDSMETGEEGEEAPLLEEEYELNGDSHLDDEMEEEEEEEKGMVVSLKVLKCSFCAFASRTRDAMDMHMAEEHPDEVLAGLTGTGSPEMEDEDIAPIVTPQKNGVAKNNQTGEMRRILGISAAE